MSTLEQLFEAQQEQIAELEGALVECRRLLDIADALIHQPGGIPSYIHQVPIKVIERLEQFERGIREDRKKR